MINREIKAQVKKCTWKRVVTPNISCSGEQAHLQCPLSRQSKAHLPLGWYRSCRPPGAPTTSQVWVCRTRTSPHRWHGTFLQSLQSGRVLVSMPWRILAQRRVFTLRTCMVVPIIKHSVANRIPGLLCSWSASICVPVRPSKKESTNWQWSSPWPVWSPML